MYYIFIYSILLFMIMKSLHKYSLKIYSNWNCWRK